VALAVAVGAKQTRRSFLEVQVHQVRGTRAEKGFHLRVRITEEEAAAAVQVRLVTMEPTRFLTAAMVE
jgi:hypothetical protein